ncbi:nitric oxide dioxygenase [Dyadobacter jejuensis]|uniref:Flavohemoprotein n=1 Tax=Dyadobacter jejuensis TaxID=1082580 RepID=A0A316ART6_9BACT|nr:NO-inducible flavohemoprotein [Dyadobacter jejuensis]PWJ60039.1 nitric oxide dioxygenase [Dyadobacter jejuensis]
MLTTEQKELVKATVPILKESGVLLTDYFYKRMLSGNPELKHVFNLANQRNKKQQTALAMAVLAYAEHIEDPSVLMPVVDGIGHKHVSLNIRPEQYMIVGKHLIASIGEVLGEAATPALLEAWTAAYNQLASIMTGHEDGLYHQQVQRPGGWSGWKPFTIKKKQKESSEITSFYLVPTDGGPVADFIPGQYLSIRLFIPELGLLQPRQYSISNAPNGEYYRISVKKEGAPEPNPDGLISNRLHSHVQEGDIVEVTAPAGSFFLKDQGDHPAIFISGGVGQTPLMSMLEALIRTGSKKPKTWIYGCKDIDAHAFKDQLELWAKENKEVSKHIFYDTPPTPPHTEQAYQGWVDLDLLDEAILAPNADYYICGPAPFITKHMKALLEKGIRREAIHFEEFGPQTLSFNEN